MNTGAGFKPTCPLIFFLAEQGFFRAHTRTTPFLHVTSIATKTKMVTSGVRGRESPVQRPEVCLAMHMRALEGTLVQAI